MLAQIAPLPIPAPPSERDLAGLTVAIVGVTIISLLTLLAAGMTFLGRSRRSDAATLQACVAEAIAADVECARVDVVTTVDSSAAMPASVTLEGVVGSAAARDRALRRAEAAARRVAPRVTVIDRLTVEADRAA